MEKYLQVLLLVNWSDQSWEIKFFDINKEKEIGEISGSIEKIDEVKCFIITNSDLENDYQGKGIGFYMYELSVKKILDTFDGVEFRSSTQLNDFSRSVWEKMCKKYANGEKKRGYYCFSRKKQYL